MADATCTGCGAELAAGRSVCGACGALNFAPTTGSFAPPPSPAPAPPAYAPPASSGSAPALLPARRPVYGAWVFAVVVVLVLIAVGAAVVRSSADDDQAARADRTVVDGGDGLTWTMVGEPEKDVREDDDADGRSLRMESWIAEDPSDPAGSGEAVFTFQRDGEAVSIQRCLEYAVDQNGGEVITDPVPLVVAGEEGSMVLASMHGDIDGFMRMVAVPIGNRTFVFLSAVNGDDRAEGEQPFAELIESVEA